MQAMGNDGDAVLVAERLDEDEKFRHMDSSLSSLLASKGEQTDRIVFFSPKDTKEQEIEAAVNESNTLHNESSVIVNDSSNINSRLDSNQQKASSSEKESNLLSKEIKIDAFVNQPIFEYKFHGNTQSDDNSQHLSSQQVFADEEAEKFDLRDLQRFSRHEHSSQREQRPLLRIMFGDEKFLLDR